MTNIKDNLSAGQMKFLLILWRTHSLSQTALMLDMSVATASRILVNMREIFGDPLFVRGGNTMVPSHRMELLVPKMEQALEAIDQLVCDEVFEPKLIDRIFVLSMNDNAFITLLLPVIAEIQAMSRDLKIRVVAPDNYLVNSLRDSRVDLAFYYDPDRRPLPPDIRSQQLFLSEHVVVVRGDHPLTKMSQEGQGVTLEALAKFPMASLRLPNPQGDNTFEVMVKEEEEPPFKTFVETPFFSTIPFILQESDAFAVMPRELAEAYQRMMPLFVLKEAGQLLPGFRRPWTPTICWHNRHTDDYALQWLRSVIVAHFEKKRLQNGSKY